MALIACGYLGDKYSNRILISCSGLVLAIIGMVLVVALPASQNAGRLVGYYLTQASPTPFVALLSLIATNVAGYTKKTTVAALYLIGYCAGNIIGLYFALELLLLGIDCLTRTTNVPAQQLHACRNHYHRVLVRMPGRLGLYLVVLSASEQEQGCN